MANERLRSIMLGKGFTIEDLAKEAHVDPKTVERWISTGRVPHRRHRYAIAAALSEDEAYLWPDGLPERQRADAAAAEILEVVPHRSLMPNDVWLEFFGRAEREIGVLVHAGGFLAEDVRFRRLLLDKASEGARVRILLGDPDSPEIQRRGQEEGLGEGVAFKVRNALVMYQPIIGQPGIEFRLHRASLHNSIYQADDEFLINTQIYGVSAPLAPVLRLRRVAGAELVSAYERSFERTWDEATPYTGITS